MPEPAAKSVLTDVPKPPPHPCTIIVQSSLWSLWRAQDVARKVLDMGHKRMRRRNSGPPSWFETARALTSGASLERLEGRAPPHHEGGSQGVPQIASSRGRDAGAHRDAGAFALPGPTT